MKTFVLNYRVNGRKPGIITKIINMTLNASGIRDISRVLGISPNTVIKRTKKKINT
jgi:transposase-like protein